MAKVLIGVPRKPGRDTRLFEASLSLFISELEKEHEIEFCERHGNRVDEVREEIVREFLSTDNHLLLFLDDDHTGHTMDMFNALLWQDTYVCAIKCYSRYFPHFCTLMDKHISRKNGYDQAGHKYGCHPCEFVGFGMTLIKRETFSFIDKPYFVASERNDKEDTYFCGKLEDAGIISVGCFDYTLTHDGIDESNIEDFRRENGIKFIAEKQRENLKKSFKEQREGKLCQEHQEQYR